MFFFDNGFFSHRILLFSIILETTHKVKRIYYPCTKKHEKKMRSIFLQFLADLKHFPRSKNAYKDGNFVFRKKNARQEKKRFRVCKKTPLSYECVFHKNIILLRTYFYRRKICKKKSAKSRSAWKIVRLKNFRRSSKIDFRAHLVSHLANMQPLW